MTNKTKCLQCGNIFEKPKHKPNAKFCSAPCRQSGNAKLSAQKRGDVQRYRGNGLSYIKLNGRHMHRVVAEKMIGRPLMRNEVVHHKDGNFRNNNPNNLQVMIRSEHTRLHSTKYNSVCSVNGCGAKHIARGYCEMHYCQYKRNGRIISAERIRKKCQRYT